MSTEAGTPPKTLPSREEIQGWLQLYVAESVQARVEQIDVNLPFSHYGLDSVAALGISGELEIWLGRQLPPTLIWDYPNIGMLAGFLAQG